MFYILSADLNDVIIFWYYEKLSEGLEAKWNSSNWRNLIDISNDFHFYNFELYKAMTIVLLTCDLIGYLKKHWYLHVNFYIIIRIQVFNNYQKNSWIMKMNNENINAYVNWYLFDKLLSPHYTVTWTILRRWMRQTPYFEVCNYNIDIS